MSTSRTEDALASIRLRTDQPCDVALILGSGLSELAAAVDDACRIPFGEIAGFPVATAPGHAGNLAIGSLGGQRVAVLQGRLHPYEGWRPAEIALPVRTLRGLGAKVLIVTNAAGALNQGYAPGDVMLIDDHINFTGMNPLIGANDDALGLRFPDMSRAYDPELRLLAETTLDELGTPFRRGVYAGVTGPSLETSAERRFFRLAGADAVGMSTVLEVIAAVHAGMRVIGFSAITNMATGGADQQPDSIEAVHENAAIAAAKIGATIAALLPKLGRAPR